MPCFCYNNSLSATLSCSQVFCVSVAYERPIVITSKQPGTLRCRWIQLYPAVMSVLHHCPIFILLDMWLDNEKRSEIICVQHRHRIFLQEFLTASCRTKVLPELNCKKNRETGQYERHCQGDLQISVIKCDADVLQARGGRPRGSCGKATTDAPASSSIVVR